jgi:hypothetical protein
LGGFDKYQKEGEKKAISDEILNRGCNYDYYKEKGGKNLCLSR